MKRSHSAFILFIIPSLSFGINFNLDTIDFTDTNNYIWLINNNSSNITIDTIVFTIDSLKTQYFNNSNLLIDTVKNNGYFSSLYRYFVSIIDTTAFAFYQGYGNIVGINNNDSISIKHIRIQDINYGIPGPYIPHNIIDTIKMKFISSDNSTDSIIAILNMLYTTDVKYINENVKLRNTKGNYPQKYYLLNGKTIDNNTLTKKNIKIIQH
jgi:hypothetical protein